MTDLYPDHPQYTRHDGAGNGQFTPLNTDVQYPSHGNLPPTSTSSNTPSSPEGDSPLQTTPKSDVGSTTPSAAANAAASRPEGKQQATFLTKLYALLERPDNHHMIRWDPQGEHIIVEKPEQLAIHVLPSVYRQSRFASFSRQLNIYGFMRKVNLRNVDPAIDDPDASTWSHPTLNRHSPADVVANFKRRVPPRIPKSKKRAEEAAQAAAAAQQNMSPRSAGGFVPMQQMGRARALTAPGSFSPLNQGAPVAWGQQGYPRSAIPPLNVPGGHYPPDMAHGGGMFTHHPGGYPQHPHHMSPTEDGPGFGSMHHPNGNREMMMPPQQYPYPPENGQWGFNNPANGGHSGGSLSSLLNPAGGGYPRPSVNTYGGNFPPGMGGPQHSPASPADSRPNTGYSVASAASGYDEKAGHFAYDHSRPNSSHHRQMSPGPGSRPGSSHQPNFQPQSGSLRVGRGRRHSQAPYPIPYDGPDGRPSTSPDAPGDHNLSRVRSMVQLPSSAAGGESNNNYNFNNSHGDFAYSAGPMPPGNGMDSMDVYSTSIRPSTSTSSLSAASHASSQANTPPVTGGGGPDADINRFSPDFGFIPINDKMPHYNKMAVGEL